MTHAHSPVSLTDALRILGEAGEGAMPVAGCTDLMVVDHAMARRHPAVVDIMRLPELQGIELADGHLDIGATTSFYAIRQSQLVKKHAPTLATIAGTVGAWQIQNRATIGGNIANASPAGDSLPVLLSLGARLVIAGPKGERTVSYDSFHLDYRKTDLRPGELIKRVQIPLPASGAFATVKKVGTREAQAISKVIVAFHANTDGGKLTDVRIGAGSVAATPIRLTDAEAALEGQPFNASLPNVAAEAARRQVKPIDDVRSTATYRHFVLGQVVMRMVSDAMATAD